MVSTHSNSEKSHPPSTSTSTSNGRQRPHLREGPAELGRGGGGDDRQPPGRGEADGGAVPRAGGEDRGRQPPRGAGGGRGAGQGRVVGRVGGAGRGGQAPREGQQRVDPQLPRRRRRHLRRHHRLRRDLPPPHQGRARPPGGAPQASERRDLRHRRRRPHAAVGGGPRGHAGAHQHAPPGLLRHQVRDPRGHHQAAQHGRQPLPPAPGHHHRVRRPRAALLHRGPHHRAPQRAGHHRGRQEGGRRRGVQGRRHRGRLLQAQPQGGPRHRQRHLRGLRARRHGAVRLQRARCPLRGAVRRVLRGDERQARVHGPPHPQAEAPPWVHRGRGHHGAHPGGERVHGPRQEGERDRHPAQAEAGQVRAPHVAAVAGAPDRGHPLRHQVHRARGQLRQRQPRHRRPPRQGAPRRQLPGHAHRGVHGQHPPRHRQHRQAHVRAVLRARQRVLQQRAHLQPGGQPLPEPGLRVQGHGDRHGLLLLRAAVPCQPGDQPRPERGAAQPGRELPGPRLGEEDRRGGGHPEAHVLHIHGGAVPGHRPPPPGGEHQDLREELRDAGVEEGADHEPHRRPLQRAVQREEPHHRHRQGGGVQLRRRRVQRQLPADAEAARRAGRPRAHHGGGGGRGRGHGVLQDHQVRGGAAVGAAEGDRGGPRGVREGRGADPEPDQGEQVVPAVSLRPRGAGLRVPHRREAAVPRRGVQQGVPGHQPGQAHRPHAGVPQGVERRAPAHQRLERCWCVQSTQDRSRSVSVQE